MCQFDYPYYNKATAVVSIGIINPLNGKARVQGLTSSLPRKLNTEIGRRGIMLLEYWSFSMQQIFHLFCEYKYPAFDPIGSSGSKIRARQTLTRPLYATMFLKGSYMTKSRFWFFGLVG